MWRTNFPQNSVWIFDWKEVSRTRVKRAVELLPSPSPINDPKKKVVQILRCIAFEKPRSGFSNVDLVQDKIQKPRSGFSNVYLVQDEIEKPQVVSQTHNQYRIKLRNHVMVFQTYKQYRMKQRNHGVVLCEQDQKYYFEKEGRFGKIDSSISQYINKLGVVTI